MNTKKIYGSVRPYLKKLGVLSLARRFATAKQRENVAIKLGLAGFSPPIKPIRPDRYRGQVRLDGINYLTDMRANIGLGEAARMIFRAAVASGLPVNYQEVTTPAVSRNHDLPPNTQQSPELCGVSLINLIPSEMPFAVDAYPDSFTQGYNIGFWLWEVPRFPENWRPAFDLLDEVWTPSTYTQAILSKISPIPVTYMPIPIQMAEVGGKRSDFNLPEDRFIFIFSFNPTSSMARKNPYAILEAYQRAFRNTPNRPLLVIKVHHLDAPLNVTIAADFRRAAKAAGVTLLEGDLTRQQMNNLLALCDCYISLHRAEGFGLGIAESMALGKPVIATAYSANTDFMTDENSFGVNYTLRPITIEDHAKQPFLLDIYKAQPGQVWAEPDVNHAAELMRYVFEHPDEARRRGELAKRDITDGWSVEAIGARIYARLESLSRNHPQSVE